MPLRVIVSEAQQDGVSQAPIPRLEHFAKILQYVISTNQVPLFILEPTLTLYRAIL